MAAEMDLVYLPERHLVPGASGPVTADNPDYHESPLSADVTSMNPMDVFFLINPRSPPASLNHLPRRPANLCTSPYPAPALLPI